MTHPHLCLTATGLLVALVACSGGDGPTGTQTGAIQGTVAAGGTGVSGASVVLTGGSSRTTDGSGTFRFDGVSAGNHTLRLTAMPQGYELDTGETEEKPVTVTAGQTATVGWSIRLSELPTEVDIQMESSSFVPDDVTIALGGKVRWVNARAIPHTITPSNPSQTGAWQSHNVPAEQNYSFSHTFNTVGTYNYSCQIHAGMNGTIEVK